MWSSNKDIPFFVWGSRNYESPCSIVTCERRLSAWLAMQQCQTEALFSNTNNVSEITAEMVTSASKIAIFTAHALGLISKAASLKFNCLI